MKQQTAVKQIMLEIKEQMDLLIMDSKNNVYWSDYVMYQCLKNILTKCKQAKAMEKDQIIDAFDTGTTDKDRIGKEYYNETYDK